MKSLIHTALALVALVTLAAPKPVYDLRTNVTRGEGGKAAVAVEIRSEAGVSLFTKSVEMKPGKQKFGSPYGDVRIEITSHGWGLATLGDAFSVFERELPVGYVRFQKGIGIDAPKTIRRVEPRFPGKAASARFSGRALVDVKLDASGKVEGVRIVRDPGYDLGAMAAEAVRQWSFEPAMKDGKPVAVLFTVPVNFRFN